MAKKFVSATVIYHGGVSYSVGSHKFRKGIPEVITNERLAKELKAKPNFGVSILEQEMSEAEAALAPKKKKVTKKKRSLRRKPK